MNKMLFRFIFMFPFALILFSCEKSTQSMLYVPFSEKEIKVDGAIKEAAWEQVILVENLFSPWDKRAQTKQNSKLS